MYLHVSVFSNAQEGNVKLHHKMVVNQRNSCSMSQVLAGVQHVLQKYLAMQQHIIMLYIFNLAAVFMSLIQNQETGPDLLNVLILITDLL